MKLQLLQDLKNHGPLPPIFFKPNTTIGERFKKLGLPEGWNQDLTKRDKHQDSIDLCNNLKDQKRWVIIEVPCAYQEDNIHTDPLVIGKNL